MCCFKLHLAGTVSPAISSDMLFQEDLLFHAIRPQDLLSHEPTLWFTPTIFLGPTKSHKVLGKCCLISKLISCECQLPKLRDEILRVKNDIRPILFHWQVLPTKRHATSGVITVAVPFNPREIRTSLDACCCLTYLVCYNTGE